jgi:chromosome segregation ATPase
MAQTPDDFDEIPSIVPERDELVSHRKRKRGTAASGGSVTARHEVVEGGGTSGWVIFFITILFLGLLGTGGAAYHFYKQGLVTEEALLSASNRLITIENKLDIVDQSANEQASNLLTEIQEHFLEIDKLWAARNELRKEVGELTTAVAALRTVSTELQATVGNHEKVIRDNVTSMQARIDEINRNFAGMDNLGTQLTALNADLNRVKLLAETLDNDVTSRLNTFEQDIESINVYRLQLNQTLQTLQTSVNTLQQRVGAQ